MMNNFGSLTTPKMRKKEMIKRIKQLEEREHEITKELQNLNIWRRKHLYEHQL